MYVEEDIPRNHEEIKSPDKDNWILAMKKELTRMKKIIHGKSSHCLPERNQSVQSRCIKSRDPSMEKSQDIKHVYVRKVIPSKRLQTIVKHSRLQDTIP